MNHLSCSILFLSFFPLPIVHFLLSGQVPNSDQVDPLAQSSVVMAHFLPNHVSFRGDLKTPLQNSFTSCLHSLISPYMICTIRIYMQA